MEEELYGVEYKYSGEVLRECTDEELSLMLRSAQKKRLELATIKAQLKGAPTSKTKPHLLRKVRRDIARIKTIQQERWL